MEGASPTTDTSSNNSFVVVHSEQTDADTSASILCTHCNSINPSSSQTCIKCNNPIMNTPNNTSTPQHPPTPPSEPINNDSTNNTTTNNTTTPYSINDEKSDESDDNDNQNETQENEAEYMARYSQHNQNNINALHLSPPTQQIYPQQEQLFGNFFFRTLYISSTLILITILSFHLWFSKTNNSSFQAASNICAIGILMIFLGAIFSIIYAIVYRTYKTFKFLNIIQYITIGLYFIGGLLYWIGGCVLTSAYNKLLNDVDHIHAFSGIWFCEITYISAQAVLAGIDIQKRYLNTHGLRLVIMCLMLFFFSLIIFFCGAIWSVAQQSKIVGYGLEVTGYFIIIILIPFFIGIKLIITPEHTIQIKVDMIMAICMCVCIFFIMIGYFVLAGHGDGNEVGEYWVGFGFFMLFHGCFIVIDMSFERFLPCKWTDNINNNDNNDLEEFMLKKTPGSMY